MELQNAYRTHGQVSPEGNVTVENVPFERGAEVEIIVLADARRARESGMYPLRGTPVTLVDPMRPVAEGDWDALQ